MAWPFCEVTTNSTRMLFLVCFKIKKTFWHTNWNITSSNFWQCLDEAKNASNIRRQNQLHASPFFNTRFPNQTHHKKRIFYAQNSKGSTIHNMEAFCYFFNQPIPPFYSLLSFPNGASIPLLPSPIYLIPFYIHDAENN